MPYLSTVFPSSNGLNPSEQRWTEEERALEKHLRELPKDYFGMQRIQIASRFSVEQGRKFMPETQSLFNPTWDGFIEHYLKPVLCAAGIEDEGWMSELDSVVLYAKCHLKSECMTGQKQPLVFD